MTISNTKHAGTGLTVPVALLLAAFVVSPVALFVSKPAGYFTVPVAVIFSLLCTAAARVYWTRYSDRTIPSLETQRARAK